MTLPSFNYSILNYDLAQSTPSSTINLFWNEQMQKMKTDSIMYMTPGFDPTIGYTYKEFGLWGNALCSPILAMQQALYDMTNGNWMSGMNGMNGMNGANGGMFGFQPWNTNMNTPWGNSNNSSTTTGNSEYDALKALIIRYKEIGVKNNSLSPEALDKINTALNKSGKPEEKLEALKDLYKSLNKNKLEKALLDLPEYKEALRFAGYNLNGVNKEDDKELKKNLNKLETNITSYNADFGGLVDLATSENILRVVSYWNDTHSDENSRSIIRLVANHLPTKDDEKTNHKTLVTNLANALVNKADDLKSELEGSYPKLDAAKQKVANASNKIKDTATCTKENLTALANAFDELYAMLRMMEAERIRNNIKTKYNFINDISSTDTDFVNDDLVVKATKEDLNKEGITTVPATDDIPVEEREEISDIDERLETPEEKIEELLTKGNLQKSAKDGVYQTITTSTNEPPHFYMVKEDKLVELKAVKAIDKNGNCTMLDNTTKNLEKVETVEVTGQDIINYQKEVKQVDDLVKGGSLDKISKLSGMPAGVQLYRSQGKKEDGFKEYFVMRNNKLMKINCKYVGKSGNVVKNNGTRVPFSALKDSDFVKADTINIEDLKAKKAKEEADAARQEAENNTRADEAIKEKKYTKPEEDETDVSKGKDIADLLMGRTDDDEWGEASTLINAITKDNVHSIIRGYADEEGCGTDNILEQIASEDKDGGFLGWGRERRDAGERLRLINHIIKAVLEHCEEYGVQNKYAYTQLKAIYRTGITEKMINNEETTTIRSLDKWILKLLDIKD